MPAVLEKTIYPEQGFCPSPIVTGKFPSETEMETLSPLAFGLPVRDVHVTIDSSTARISHEFSLDESPDPEPYKAEGRETEAPTWLRPVIDRLDELFALPVNWDHQGAPRIDIADLTLATDTLSKIMHSNTPTPTIVPIRGGGLQIEWHRAGLDVEIVIGLGEDDGLYFCDSATDLDWEGPTFAGFAEHDLAIRLIG